MRNLLLGVLIGSCLTAGIVGAGDYLSTGGGNYLSNNETQAILGEIRTRQALETLDMMRRNYLDQQVNEMGRTPCR